MRALTGAGFLTLALCAGSATAQDPTAASAQGDVAVTIYNNGQSLVQDDRPLNVTRGRNRIEFPDVSARIRPETVTLSGPGIGIVEQNFDFDLLTPAKLLEKYVGEQVTVVRTVPRGSRGDVDVVTRITDPKLRRSIVELVEQMEAREDPDRA